jgi:hypothetical protein
MMAAAVAQSHGAHSHAHSHDNVYLTSQNKNDAGVRITRIGLYSNLGMAIAKGVGGYMFNSHAVSGIPLCRVLAKPYCLSTKFP